MMTLHVTDTEFHTILAALRYYQAHGQGDALNRPAWVHDLATNGGEILCSLDAAGRTRPSVTPLRP